MPRYKYRDITGQRFGRLVAIRYAGTNENGNALWRVACDCGIQFEALSSNLFAGHTKSCGCLRRDMMMGNHRNKKRPASGTDADRAITESETR